MVPVKGDMPLNDIIAPVQLSPLSSDSYAVSAQAQEDVYQISGITEYQRGASPDITRTATEAQIMQGSSNVKLDAKLKTIERAVANVGIQLLAIAREVYPVTDVDEMALFISGTEARAINQMQAGDEAKAALEMGNREEAQAIAATADLYGETIITPNDEIFAGTYQVIVEHASTDATNPQKKAEKYRHILTELANLKPLLDQAGIPVDMGRILRLWLEAEGIPGVDAILTQGQPPSAPPQMQADPSAAGMPPEMPPSPSQGGIPADFAGLEGIPPEALLSLLGGPQDAVSPENSGALDPGAYPNVGL